MMILFVAFMITTEYQLAVVPKIGKFVSVLQAVLSEFQPTISKNVSDIKLILWTRKSPLQYHTLTLGDPIPIQSLSISNYNRSNPTKVLIHGFSDKGLTSWVKTFKKKYLERYDANVISVDWEPLARSPWYTSAAKNSRLVGKYTAEYIKFLVEEGGSTYDSFHVLGASLGAHAAGFVGHYSEGKIGRITGLDPSGPLFHSVPPSDRLDRSAAKFVDIIHTAGKWVGNSEKNGHVDFYPNLGLAPQPGCEGHESLDLSCSHRKAWQMFAESIGNTAKLFFAVSCQSAEEFAEGHCCDSRALLNLAIMGEPAHNGTRGEFYLYTNTDNPLAKNKNDSINCHLT